MALKIGNVFINEDDPFPVIVKATTEIDTYIKGHHVYKNMNLSFMGTIFLSQRTKNSLFEFTAPCLCFQKPNG